MTRHYKILLILGILIFILPFLGIPDNWKNIGQFSIGLLIILLGLIYRHWYKEDNEESPFLDSSEESFEDEDDNEYLTEEDIELESVEEGYDEEIDSDLEDVKEIFDEEDVN